MKPQEKNSINVLSPVELKDEKKMFILSTKDDRFSLQALKEKVCAVKSY